MKEIWKIVGNTYEKKIKLAMVHLTQKFRMIMQEAVILTWGKKSLRKGKSYGTLLGVIAATI